MIVVAVTSGFLSNTGTAAVMNAAVLGIASRSGMRRSRSFMPLAFAPGMGGNRWLTGAPSNLIALSAQWPTALMLQTIRWASGNA